MTKNWNALLFVLLTLPAWGQEQPADASAPAADQPPAEQPPADAGAPADNGAVMDSISTDAAAESAPAEPEQVPTIPVDEAAAEGPATPWRLYGGLDWVRSTLSTSQLKGFGVADYDTGMYRGRLGARLFDAIGAEFQFGTKRNEKGIPNASTDSYFGLFLVPTATLFDTVELAFPVGYSLSKVSTKTADASLNSIGYGIDIQLPLRVFSGSLPDFRFEAGGMVYYQKTDARMYGLNAGLRYDFEVNGFHMGNPLSGVGGFFKKLWPFGKKDEPVEAAPAQ